MDRIELLAAANIPYLANSIQQGVALGAKKATPINIRATLPDINFKKFSMPLGRITGDLNQFQGALDASIARVLAFGASASVLAGVTSGLKAMVQASIEVEKALTDVNVVLGLTSGDLAKFSAGLFDVARNTGQSFKDISVAATEFARQGLGATETLKRLNDAMILSRLSGLDAAASVGTLTATINGFTKEALTSTQIINRLATVDAAFAVSTQDLANALSRSGAVAQDAGVSFNELIAAVTAVQQTTARGGAVIGNGLKSIFTRIQRTKVRDSLEEIGVSTTDSTGAFRGAIPILQDYARIYETLTDAQKSSTAESIAGVYQINTLKALIKDLNKEYSIYTGALNTAGNATDQAITRNEELNKTTAALLNRTVVSLQEFGAEFGKLSTGKALTNLLTIFDTIAAKAAKLLNPETGSTLAKAFVGGLGDFLAGPGLLIIGKTFFNLLRFLGSEVITALKQIQNLNTGKQQQQKIEASIGQLLAQNLGALERIVSSEGNRKVQEEIILGVIRNQRAEMERMAGLRSIISSVAASGMVSMTPYGVTAKPRKGKAAGFIPAFQQEEATAMSLGAPASVRGRMSQGTIGGKKFVMNSHELEIPRIGANGDSAVLPMYGRGYIPNFGMYNAGPLGRVNGRKAADLMKNPDTPKEVKDALIFDNFQIGKRAIDRATGGNSLTRKQTVEAEKLVKGTKGAKNKPDKFVNIPASKLKVGMLTGLPIEGQRDSAYKKIKDLGSGKIPLLEDIKAGRVSDRTAIRITGVPIETLYNLENNGLAGDALELKFRKDIVDYFTPFLKKYTTAIFGPLLKDKGFSKALQGARALFSTAAEGAIFESALKLASSQAGVFASLDEQDRFDYIAGKDDAVRTFFRGGKGANVDFVEAKRTATPEAIASLIRKSAGLKITRDVLVEYIDDSGELKGRHAAGYIPNFATDALSEAIGRERGAGVPSSAIRLNQSAALKNSGNPAGLAITNTIDEPNGLRDVFASGHVPNFAAARKRTTVAQKVENLLAVDKGTIERIDSLEALDDFEQALKRDTASHNLSATREKQLGSQRNELIDERRKVLTEERNSVLQAKKERRSAMASRMGMFANFGGFMAADYMRQQGGTVGKIGESVSAGLSIGTMVGMINPVAGAIAGVGVAAWNFVDKIGDKSEEFAKALEKSTASVNQSVQAGQSYLSSLEQLEAATKSGDKKMQAGIRDQLRKITETFDDQSLKISLQLAGDNVEKASEIIKKYAVESEASLKEQRMASAVSGAIAGTVAPREFGKTMSQYLMGKYSAGGISEKDIGQLSGLSSKLAQGIVGPADLYGSITGEEAPSWFNTAMKWATRIGNAPMASTDQLQFITQAKAQEQNIKEFEKILGPGFQKGLAGARARGEQNAFLKAAADAINEFRDLVELDKKVKEIAAQEKPIEDFKKALNNIAGLKLDAAIEKLASEQRGLQFAMKGFKLISDIRGKKLESAATTGILSQDDLAILTDRMKYEDETDKNFGRENVGKMGGELLAAIRSDLGIVSGKENNALIDQTKVGINAAVEAFAGKVKPLTGTTSDMSAYVDELDGLRKELTDLGADPALLEKLDKQRSELTMIKDEAALARLTFEMGQKQLVDTMRKALLRKYTESPLYNRGEDFSAAARRRWELERGKTGGDRETTQTLNELNNAVQKFAGPNNVFATLSEFSTGSRNAMQNLVDEGVAGGIFTPTGIQGGKRRGIVERNTKTGEIDIAKTLENVNRGAGGFLASSAPLADRIVKKIGAGGLPTGKETLTLQKVSRAIGIQTTIQEWKKNQQDTSQALSMAYQKSGPGNYGKLAENYRGAMTGIQQSRTVSDWADVSRVSTDKDWERFLQAFVSTGGAPEGIDKQGNVTSKGKQWAAKYLRGGQLTSEGREMVAGWSRDQMMKFTSKFATSNTEKLLQDINDKIEKETKVLDAAALTLGTAIGKLSGLTTEIKIDSIVDLGKIEIDQEALGEYAAKIDLALKELQELKMQMNLNEKMRYGQKPSAAP